MNKCSTGQLFALITVPRIFLLLADPPQLGLSFLTGSLLCIAAELIIFTPLCALAGEIHGGVAGGIFSLYFLGFGAYTVGRFFLFSDSLTPVGGAAGTVILLLAAIYGASLGRRAVGKTAAVTAFLCIAALAVIFILPLGDMRRENISRGDEMLRGFLSELSSGGALPALLLFPKKGRQKALLFYGGVSALLITLSVVIPMGVLGGFGIISDFPLLSLGAVEEFGAIRRLDILTLGIWSMGAFVTAAAAIIFCSHSLPLGKFSAVIYGLIILLSGLLLQGKGEILSGLIPMSAAVLTAAVFAVYNLTKRRKRQ